VEDEIKRLLTATWQWENQSEKNLLGDLQVYQKLPGKPPSFRSDGWNTMKWQNVDTSLATRKHEQTGKMAFFNNMVSRYLNAIKAGVWSRFT